MVNNKNKQSDETISNTEKLKSILSELLVPTKQINPRYGTERLLCLCEYILRKYINKEELISVIRELGFTVREKETDFYINLSSRDLKKLTVALYPDVAAHYGWIKGVSIPQGHFWTDSFIGVS